MKVLGAVFAAALAIGTAGAQTVDSTKLGPLHDAGEAFERGLADPGASVEQVVDLRQKLEREAAGFAGKPATAEEKKIADLYASAAREYAQARDRFDRDKARVPFFADLRRIQAELKEADDLFGGTVKLAPSPPPIVVAPPPVAAPPKPAPVVPPAPAPVPPPPPPVPPAVATPPPVEIPLPPAAEPPTPVTPPPPVEIPPPPTMAPAPTPEPKSSPPPPPPVVAPPPAPVPAPPAMEPPAPPPPPPTPERKEVPPREEAAAVSPVPEPKPPRADVSLNNFRKAANRVKIEKDPKTASGCQKIADISVANSGSGVYEVAGHNFYYGSADELIRLKTAEAGGDRFVVKARTKTEISGEAYRCGK